MDKLTIIVFAFLTFGLGCRPSTVPATPVVPVKVVINSWPGLGPYYVAQAKQFDQEEGIKLLVTMNEDTTVRHSALESGEADLVGITLDAVVIARARGVPMVVVGQSDFSSGGDGIIATNAIRSVADLKGKRIAYSPGQPSEFFLLFVLRKQNLGLKDFTKVPAGDGSLAATLFTAGSADAAVTWDPWISQVEKLTKGHVVITTRDTPGVILGIVAANSDLLSQRKDRIVRSQRAWLKAVDYCRQHPQEAAQIMAKNYNVPMADFRRMAGGAQLADLGDELSTFGTPHRPGPIVQLVNDANAIWLQSGAIDRPVDPKSVIDWTIVEELRKGAR